MARRPIFTEAMILEAARKVKAKGKSVSPWAVRTELGGGKVSRIESILLENEVSVLDVEQTVEQQVLSLPSQFAPQVKQMQEAMHLTACDMWRAATEMADNRVRDEFVAAKTAKDTGLRELSEARDAVDQQEDDMELLENELDSANASNKQLQNDLKNSQTKTTDVEAECRALKEQLAVLRTVNSELEASNKQLEKDHHYMTAKLESLSDRHKTVVERCEDECNEHEITKNDLTECTQKVSASNVTIASQAIKIDEQNKRILALSIETGEFKQENKALNKNIGMVTAQLDDRKVQIAELIKKISELSDDLDGRVKTTLEVEFQLKKAREEITAFNKKSGTQ